LCQAAVDAIEPYLWADAADYSFAGTTFSNVVYDRFQLVPDAEGKVFHLTASYVLCYFVMFGRSQV
jgi:hypothetical protein